ncbi:hypothetical protein D9619_011477 [Psilocybe cf. subviscida]|uniref:Uncharacterized protein n=1 Tax=Psilocybe cf. subviscida TaxID=2480587 RepID=A0A8H5BS43_9AGAR|nr:hypothetical protein D9619_011477 [Psilocybe cf. subviscida]
MNAVPPKILALRDALRNVAKTDSVNLSEPDGEPSGKANLIGRVNSTSYVSNIWKNTMSVCVRLGSYGGYHL